MKLPLFFGLAIVLAFAALAGAGSFPARAGPRVTPATPASPLHRQLLKPTTIATVREPIVALAQREGRIAWLRGSSKCPRVEVVPSLP